MTIKDIAQQADASIGAVHGALNGKNDVGEDAHISRVAMIARDCSGQYRIPK